MLIVEKWEKIEKHCEENRKHLQLSNFVNIWVFTSSLLFNSDYLFSFGGIARASPCLLVLPPVGLWPQHPAYVCPDFLRPAPLGLVAVSQYHK